MNKKTTLVLGIAIGIILSSSFWWILRAKELAPIMAERDCASVIVLVDAQDLAKKLLIELEKNPQKVNDISKKWMIRHIELFIEEYEILKSNHPNITSYDSYYIEAKDFLQKYNDNNIRNTKITEQKDTSNSDSAAAKPE